MYSKLNFCYELVNLINKNSDDEDIAQWANDTYLDNLHIHNKDQDLLNMLDNLRYIYLNQALKYQEKECCRCVMFC